MSTDSWVSAFIGALVAIGGGQGLGAALTALRGRSGKPTSTPPPAPRLSQVSYPDLNDELHQLRREMHEQIAAAREECDREREELSRRHDEQYRILTERIMELTKSIGVVLGRVDRQSSPGSRRGR